MADAKMIEPPVSSTENHDEIKLGPPPFDVEDADVVLRSSDHVDFRVYKLILSLASPFFKTLFTIPQPRSEGAGTAGVLADRMDDVPVVPISETAPTLDAVLRLVYPIEDAVLDTLTHIRPVLAAAIKYELEEATIVLAGRLLALSAGGSTPIGVFATLCHHRLGEEARVAAKYCLREPFADLLNQMTLPDIYLTSAAPSYLRLLQYHSRCSQILGKITPGELFTAARHWLPDCRACGAMFTISPPGQIGLLPVEIRYRPKFWHLFNQNLIERLKIRPCGDKVMDLELLVLSLAVRCPNCPVDASQRILTYRESVKVVIDEKVSSVELDLGF
ncbi:hypothetical protein JAAARDRAFT_201414 [Jaapia argillacea MUCL 33604]|uniref:BTB domain-containing protein n=1 Tax=Jaapia argillacea MUCL 33604 TaxID=933084 RepID=A0A067QKC4_9AGAM|nr:hypothetical protein JAAARDRAFT_201414 [Jaapia argillacea MUCL 33604]